jgi:hypothetical protein
MISTQIENIVRNKIRQYNVMMGAQSQPGQVPGMVEGGSAPGIIPGPVSMMGGDNTMTPTKSGEYILPVEAVIGLGVRAGATSHGDALAIGKHLLDKTVMGLKKEMGNNTPPRNAGIDVGGSETGYAEGGIFSSAGDWVDRNVIQPIKDLAQPQPGIPVTPQPLQPNQVGTGYLSDSGDKAQTHNQAVEQVADDSGYAQGGMIDGAGNWINQNIINPIKTRILPNTTGAPIGTGLIAPLSAPTPTTGIPMTAPLQPNQVGSGYLNRSGTAAQSHNQAVIDAVNETGYDQGGYVTDDQQYSEIVDPVVTKPTTGISTAPPAPTPRLPAVIPEPATPGTPSGHANVDGKNINYADIGVKGQDPLMAGYDPSKNTTPGIIAPTYHGMALEHSREQGYTYNPNSNSYEKVDPTIWVGTPGGIQSTVKESEAFSKGLMSSKQRADYQDRQLLEKKLESEKLVTGIDVNSKLASAELDRAKAVALTTGGGKMSGVITDDGTNREIRMFNGSPHTINPTTGEPEPYTGGLKKIGAAGGTTQPLVDPGLPDSTGKRPGALEGASSGEQSIIKNLIDYKMPLPGGFALKTPYWQNILERASAYDSSFDASQYNVRLKTRNDFTTGKSAQNIRSLNTAIGHLDTLAKNADKLGNYDTRIFNTIGNYISKEVGNPKVTQFNTALTAVENELASVFKNTGATDQEIKAWRDNINSSQSPIQLKKNIDTAVELLGSRLDVLNNQYEKGIGKPKSMKFLTPKSEQILKRLGGNLDMLDPVVESNQPGIDISTTPVAGGEQPMTSLPPAAQHKGRIVKSNDGSRLQSDGSKWVQVR